MTAYTLSPIWGAGAQLFDNNGDPLSGGKIYVYEAGTTTPAVTYTGPTGTALNTNPIIANAAGRLNNEIWFFEGQSFKFVLKDATDVLLATYDDIPSLPQPAITNDASTISYQTPYQVSAGNFTIGATYRISAVGTTDFTQIGAEANVTGILFTATGIGSGTGTAQYTRTVQNKLREMISVKDFGAIGDGVVNDLPAIQTAINYCVLNGFRELYVNEGTYLIDGTLQIRPPNSSSFVSLALIGAQGSFLGITKFVHASGQKLNPLLAIQGVRDVLIKNIRLNGTNVAPSSPAVGNSEWRNPDPTAYVTAGCSAGRYNPYAGIAIDSLYGAAPANPADQYTYDTYNFNQLSSKIKIEGCRIENFVVGAICNSVTGSENYVFDRTMFIENKFAIATTGTQQRNIIADNCDFNGHWVIFDNITFQAQNGPPIAFQDGIFGAAYRMFQVKMDVGVISMRGGYFESVSSLGMIGVNNSSAFLCAHFTGVNFSLIGYDQTGTQVNKDIALLVNGAVAFTGCNFTTQFTQHIIGDRPVHFNSCTFTADSPSITADEKEYFRVYTNLSGEGKIILENCYQRSYSGTTKFFNNTQFVSTLPIRALLNPTVTEIVNTVTSKRYVIQPPAIVGYGDVTGVTNVSYVDADTLTFDFTVTVTAPLNIGDTLIWRCLAPALEGATPNTYFAPALYVSNIVGTTATCKIIAVVDTSYAPTSVTIVISKFINATVSTGNTTSGNADILNVTNVANFRVGDWLSFSDSSMVSAVRITNIVGTTITCHRTLNITLNGVQIYNTKLLDINPVLQRILYGTGSPQNVVVADPGTLFLRSDNAPGTALYVKESGTGYTGWVAK